MKIYENEKYQKSVANIASKLTINEASFLITGATGLIGSCIADVIIYAKNNYGKAYKIYLLGRSKERLKNRFIDFVDDEDIILLEQDICEPLQIDENVDYIIHAASNADPCSYAKYPVETILTNVYGINNVLSYCKKHDNKRVLFTSTFEVYGQVPNGMEYKEDDYGLIDYNQIRSCYPESKRTAEILMRCYAKEYGIDFVIARLCSIYGPTMLENDSKAHAQFMRNALNNENIVLKSEGKQMRTYCYLFDAIDAILHVLFNGDSGEVYNISNEKSISSIAEVAETIARIAGLKVVFDLPSELERQGFSKPQDIVLDNSKLINIGWKGSYSLEEGIKETLQILSEIKIDKC